MWALLLFPIIILCAYLIMRHPTCEDCGIKMVDCGEDEKFKYMCPHCNKSVTYK
jgi:hypothetical protein